MTRGNYTVFQEGLNFKFICFRFDSLSLNPNGVNLTHPAPVVSCCLFLVFVLKCFLPFLRPRREDRTHIRAALRALLTVITPTCSLWPSHYIEFASAPCSRISIPLEVIIEDMADGVIEFCDPIKDLADLIGSGATTNEHIVCIIIGWKWWINCFQWWMLLKFKSGYPSLRSLEYMLGLFDSLHRNMRAANSNPSSLPLGPFAVMLSTINSSLCLDYLPDDVILTLHTGCKMTLEFTTFSPSLQTLSTAQILSAIPFIISEHSRRWPRPLVLVLKQLSILYGPNLVVTSLSNVSADYENALRHVYMSSSGAQKVHEMWVKDQSIKGWRRSLFLVALETALVRRGWIERWAVQVTAK